MMHSQSLSLRSFSEFVHLRASKMRVFGTFLGVALFSVWGGMCVVAELASNEVQIQQS